MCLKEKNPIYASQIESSIFKKCLFTFHEYFKIFDDALCFHFTTTCAFYIPYWNTEVSFSAVQCLYNNHQGYDL